MFCRRAWQRVGPLARRAFKPASRNAAPVRHMAFGVPGGSSNMTYFVLCGGGLTAAIVYAYKTVNGDTERYEDRLANMGSSAKAPKVATPEVAAPAPEPAPVEEEEAPAPATEVVAESALAPAEPVAETAAEPAAEAVSEEVAAVASEVVVAEAEAEPAVAEEAAPAVAVEAVPEAAPVSAEAVATEETPAEAPAAESAESMPDLLTAVKILAGSTVEIAAASVGETSLVEVVRKVEEDGKGLDVALKLVDPADLETVTEAAAEETADEAAVVVEEEEVKSAEAGADAEDSDAPAAEEETSAPVVADEEVKEEAAAAPPEEPTASAPTVEEAVEVEVDDQSPVPEAAPEDATSSTEASPEDPSPAEETTAAEEASITAEAAPAAETAVEEEPAESSAEEAVEAAAVVDTIHLAAASAGSDLEVLSAAEPESASEAPVHESKHCHSCHSAPSAGEEVATPDALEGRLAGEEAVDITHEAKEAELLVEEQKTMVMVTTQS